jgi:hypothetical protein
MQDDVQVTLARRLDEYMCRTRLGREKTGAAGVFILDDLPGTHDVPHTIHSPRTR